MTFKMFTMLATFTFLLAEVQSLLTNDTTTNEDSDNNISTQENGDGQPCELGTIRKINCNACTCSPEKKLVCTKMVCPKPKSDEEKQKRLNKARFWKAYPALPDGECVPGQIYRNRCSKCFCDDNKVAACVERACKDPDSWRLALRPTDVKPGLRSEDLPILANGASKCKPGKAYTVQCNACLCMADGNLLCEKYLCLDEDEEGVPRRRGAKIQQPFSENLKNAIDPRKEKCQPHTAYKIDCNMCYCQEDGALFCTQRGCLNYQDSLYVAKVRKQLGLD